jgi:hypothetical protein
MKKMFFLLLGVVVILAGCTIPVSDRAGSNANAGSLNVSFTESGVANRTILPNIDMTIATYDVTGAGPSGATFSQLGVAVGSTITQKTLAPGNWVITVNAKNAGGTVIANGTANATVLAGQMTNVTITVTPVAGNGTLTVNVSWPAGSFTNASTTVTGTVKAVGANAINLNTFVVTGATNSAASTTTLAKGYYQLAITVTDGTKSASLSDETVRIVYSATTTANLTVTSTGTGGDTGVIIVINPQMDPPIDITIGGVPAQLTLGQNFTATSTTVPTPVDSYQWYLDGAAIAGAITSSVTTGAALPISTGHRLTLIVAKGAILSSKSVTFDVVSAPVTDPDMLADFNAGSDTDNWTGPMGAMPDTSITKTYDNTVFHGSTGSSLKLAYDLNAAGSGWNGYWLKLTAMDGTHDVAKDISSYKYLSFWVKGAVGGTEHMKIQIANKSTNAARKSAFMYVNDYLDGGITNAWQEVKIPLDGFANLDGVTNAIELDFVFEASYATAAGFSKTGTVYIDDVKFFTTSLGYVRVDHFGDTYGWSAVGGNSGSMNTSTMAYDGTIYHNFKNSLKSTYDVTATSPGWCGHYFLLGGGSDGWTAEQCNFSAYTKLTMWVKANSSTENPGKVKIEIANGTATASVYLSGITTSWAKYSIDLSAAGVDKTKIKQFNIIYENSQATNKVGTVNFDEVQFE